MVDGDLNQAFAHLRSALDRIEMGTPEAKHSADSIQALARAVDNLRTKAWVYLTTHRAGDLSLYLLEIRVRRATEACIELLSDLRAERIAAGTSGIDLLRGTLREVKTACDLVEAK